MAPVGRAAPADARPVRRAGVDAIRRVILAPEDEDEVFEVAAAKRQARVQDLGLEKLVSGGDHSAVQKALAAKQEKGPDHRPMSALRGRRNQEIAQTAKERRSEVGGLGAKGLVSSRTEGDNAPLAAALATKAEIGPTDRPIRTFNRRKKGAEDQARKGELAGQKAEEHEADVAFVESEQASMATELAAGRAAAGRPGAPAEIAELDAELEARNFKGARALLVRIKSASAGELSAASGLLAGRSADIATVKGQPINHQPPDIDGARKALEASISAGQWVFVRQQVQDFLATIDLALELHGRLTAVELEVEDLTNEQRHAYVLGQIAKHKTLTWTEVCATADETRTEGGLGFLEERLLRYQKDDAQVEASNESAKAKSASAKVEAVAAKKAANAGAVAAKEAAKALRAERIEKGILAGNGTVLAVKKVSELTGTGEKESVEQGLKGLKDKVKPRLSHWRGMVWGADHENRNAYLPGIRGAGGYKEYYLERDPASPPAHFHGSRRLAVSNDTKKVYYTWTHYGQNGDPPFVLLQE